MKLSTLFVASMCALGVMAQRSFLKLPTEGTNVTPGGKLKVQLVRPNAMEGSIEVGMVIGFVPCTTATTCPPPDGQIGSVLFNGHFNPQLHEIPAEPYQNFTVTIPTFTPVGPAQVLTARFHLIGAGPAPILEFNNVTVNVV
ncbi:hypothetical protein BDZ97DRAFT_1851249 [Flammula alnicola]|nr:hypothetical protein BDZ97DRAFT_1851249 [Flammula alnicola]